MKMKYIFLTEEFYKTYTQSNYPQLERKKDRPYIMLSIQIDGLEYAIPLRSNIRHPHVLWTDKANNCGVDFSKAVIITDPKYIDSSSKPYLRENEHKALKGKEFQIKTGMEKYIKAYKKAFKRRDIKRNDILCKMSALQYFHKELGIDQSETES